MRRREFLWLLVAAAPPLAAHAQPKSARVIGILDPSPRANAMLDAFVAGMRDLGYVEGCDIVFTRRASPDPNALPSLAAKLVQAGAEVLVTAGPPGIRACQCATASLPIVFLAMGDPVSAGMVASLAHLGGHLTGLSFDNDYLSGKRFDLLRHLIPQLRRVAVFTAGALQGRSTVAATEQTAKKLGLEFREWALTSPDAFEPAFAAAMGARLEALDVLVRPLFNENRGRLAELAAKYRLPAIYESAEYVHAGGIMAYGPVFADMTRRGAAFVDKILKGAQAGDLPVEVATRFALSLNLRAASALGLVIPPPLLAAAEEVIE